uniref:Uncharacterized protein n=1 Tax=Lepeophtheirus salmonis TaxID=72036 RepID=A0A0K2TL51_LEPSM
MDPICSSFIL